jgi:hypothetical protein
MRYENLGALRGGIIQTHLADRERQPTSGLDSQAAFEVISFVKSVARAHKVRSICPCCYLLY